MNRFKFYFQKFTLLLLLSAAFWTVLPFVVLIIDAVLNGNDSVIKVSLDYILMSWREANE